MTETSTEPKQDEQPTFEIYPALSDLMLKADIAEHLRDVHGYTSVYNQSLHGNLANLKVNKERLLEYHANAHLRLDSAVWKWTKNAKYDDATNTYMGTWVPYDVRGHTVTRGIVLPHKHEALSESADLRAAAVAARTGGQISDKPLPGQQLRLLMEIVRQDFKIIEQEIKEFAGEAKEAKFKEIREEYKAKEGDAPKLKKKAELKLAKLLEELRTMREEAGEAGISLSTPHFQSIVSFEIKGLQEALKIANEENTAALNRALARLEREKAVALRRVQLAGISPEAVKLLDELPDARKMMIDAAAQQPPKELGNGKA
jgi:hypothetical protein